MKSIYGLAVVLGAVCALHAADDPDADFNLRLVDAGRKVIFDYKLFQRYNDDKFSPEARLKEINDRVTGDDVTQDEMVSLRQESWSLNEADFNLNTARKQFRDRLAKSITGYKEIREQSKDNPAMKLPKESEAVLIKAELICKSPDNLALDVTLPSDLIKKTKPKETPAPTPKADAPKVAGANTPPGPAKTDVAPAGQSSGKKVDGAMVVALGKYNTILLGKVHGVLQRRDVPAGDERKWMVVVDVKELLRGKAIPGNSVSVFINSPAESFATYETVDDLRNRPCIYALTIKDGVVGESEAPFPQQKFDKEDIDRLRDAFKE